MKLNTLALISMLTTTSFAQEAHHFEVFGAQKYGGSSNYVNALKYKKSDPAPNLCYLNIDKVPCDDNKENTCQISGYTMENFGVGFLYFGTPKNNPELAKKALDYITGEYIKEKHFKDHTVLISNKFFKVEIPQKLIPKGYASGYYSYENLYEIISFHDDIGIDDLYMNLYDASDEIQAFLKTELEKDVPTKLGDLCDDIKVEIY